MSHSVDRIFRQTFDRPPEIVSSAPGRIEILGNHLDYNGGVVIGASIDKRLHVAVGRRSDTTIRLISEADHRIIHADIQTLASNNSDSWARYPLGACQAIRTIIRNTSEQPDPITAGFDMAVTSTIPSGAGLSSSAALGTACVGALNALWDLDLSTASKVDAAHMTEHRYSGVPCGKLDQTVVMYGRKNQFVIVDFSSNSVQLTTAPSDVTFWVFLSHKEHKLATSLYATRRRECAEAESIFSTWIPGFGRLASLHQADLDAYSDALSVAGRKRAQHVVSESARVRDFIRVLESAPKTGDHFPSFPGHLLTASHESSRIYFENSTSELDFLVRHLNECPPVLGVRLTGGGFGGGVLVATRNSFGTHDAQAVADAYMSHFDESCSFFCVHTGDGPGVTIRD